MKGILSFLVFLVIAVSLVNEPAFAQARFPFLGKVTSDRVNIRAGQDNKFASLFVVNKDTQLVVTGKSYSWYQVRLPQGAKIFISSAYVTLLTPEVGEINVERLNIRSAANADATILGQLKQAQRFLIQENQGEWLWLKPVDAARGWVHESFIEATKDPVPETLTADQYLTQKKQSVKAIPVTRLPNGQLECAGQLQRPDAQNPNYRIFRDGITLCTLEGPQSAMEPFAGSSVIVEGAFKSQSMLSEPPVIAISKVRRAIR